MKAIKFVKSNAVDIIKGCPQHPWQLQQMLTIFENMGGVWYAVMHNAQGDLDMNTWEELEDDYPLTDEDRVKIETNWVEVVPI